MPPSSLRERALRYLAQRDHSRQELVRKLASHGTNDEIMELLQRLNELELICDSRFAESYVRTKAQRMGSARLRLELARRGVAREIIDQSLDRAEIDTELARAEALWHQKFGTPPADAREWARQARFLQGRGFSTDIIRKVLKDCHDESA